MKPPVTLGHEPYGTIVAAGPEAGDVPIGADRLVCPWIGCGICARCREGQDNYCMAPRNIGVQRPGGYADHLLVPHPKYLVDASGVDPAWAATLSCSGLTTYSAVSKLNPIPSDEWVAVMGAGGLGLMAIEMLKAAGHQRIVSVDVDAAKLAAARAAGCSGSRRWPRPGSGESAQGNHRWDHLRSGRSGRRCEHGDSGARRTAQRRQADTCRSVRRRDSAVTGVTHPASDHHTGFLRRHGRRIEGGGCACLCRQAQDLSRSKRGRCRKSVAASNNSKREPIIGRVVAEI